VTDRLIRITTALAVVAVAVVATVISYQHAYELVRSHGESGVTARLVPVLSRRADLGRLHGGTGRQPPGPAGTTAGGVEPGGRDLRHDRCQSGARGGTRADRRIGQRLATRGLVEAFSSWGEPDRYSLADSAC
jgi:hypothetical protein